MDLYKLYVASCNDDISHAIFVRKLFTLAEQS